MELEYTDPVKEWSDGFDKRIEKLQRAAAKIKRLENIEAVVQIIASTVAIIGNIIGIVGFGLNFVQGKGGDSVLLVLIGGTIVAVDFIANYVIAFIMLILMKICFSRSDTESITEEEKTKLEKVKDKAGIEGINLIETFGFYSKVCIAVFIKNSESMHITLASYYVQDSYMYSIYR